MITEYAIFHNDYFLLNKTPRFYVFESNMGDLLHENAFPTLADAMRFVAEQIEIGGKDVKITVHN